MSLKDFYISTVIIQSKTDVSDSMGGYTSTWATASTTTGRLKTLNANEQILNEQKKSITTHRLFLNADETINVTNRVVIGTDTYEVMTKNILNTKTEAHHLEIDLKKIE